MHFDIFEKAASFVGSVFHDLDGKLVYTASNVVVTALVIGKIRNGGSKDEVSIC